MILRYRAITLERPIAHILPGTTMTDAFLASDGFAITRDLEADPMTVRVSHPRGLAAHDVPWTRVTDSQREEGAIDEVKSVPAACMPPEAARAAPMALPGAMSPDSREALERDGVAVTTPRGKKGGWPGGKKKSEASA